MEARNWLTAWQQHEGWAVLAAYASIKSLPAELRPAGKVADYDSGLDDAELDAARAELAEHLFATLAEQRWLYVTEPWYPGQGQLLRDPVTITSGRAATCLDIALLYTAMAKAAGLHPRLGILTGAVASHAVVLIPKSAPVRTTRDRSVAEWALPHNRVGNYFAVDVTRALLADAGAPTGTWMDALDCGVRHFDAETQYESCQVIDATVASEQHPEVEPLDDSVPRPVIYRMLPKLGRQITLHEWQLEVGADAAGFGASGGCLVVAGPSGMGKTAAALRPAYTTAHGSGWLLDASNKTTLQRSYVAAEVGSRPQLSESAGYVGLHTQALARLANTQFPWVVILDGADHPDGPTHYAGLIPTPNHEGQLVLITTTEVEAWRAWVAQDQGHRGLREVPEGAPSPLIHGLGGTEGDDVGQLVAGRVAELGDERAREFAVILGWTPPVSAPRSARVPELTAARYYRQLVDLGLVDSSSLIMHRKVREAIRSGVCGQPDPGLLTEMINAIPQAFATVSDASYRDQLTGIFRDEPDQRARTAGLLAIAEALTRNEPQLASKLYQDVLTEMGWTLGGAWLPVDDERAVRARSCVEGVTRAAWRAGSVAKGLNPDLYRTVDLAAAAIAIPVPGQDELAKLTQDKRLEALALNASRSIIDRDASLSEEQKLARLTKLIQDMNALVTWREEHLPPGHPDIARALYNVAGAHIPLGRYTPEEGKASVYRQALDGYQGVYARRRKAFGTDAVEDVACCLYGQGIALYYLALHDRSTPVRDRLAMLGQASELTSRSLVARQAVSWGDDSVGGTVENSAFLLHKITFTLMDVHQRCIRGNGKAIGDGPLAAASKGQEESRGLIDGLVPQKFRKG